VTRRYFTSTAVNTTLTAELSASATSMTVDAATFTGYPALFPYTLVLDEGLSTEEVIEISTVAGTTLTIGTRGVDSTTPQIHLNGASVKLGVSARDFNEANAHVYLDAQTATKHSGVHGLAGQVVGTTDMQTLTNKTLTSPTIATSLVLDTGAYIQFEGSTANAFETILTVVDPTIDRTVTIPDATTTLVGTNTTDTLTNKSISGATNTLTAIPLTTAVTGLLPVANGGNGIDTSAAWLSFTPTYTNVTSGAGTFSYRKVGTTLFYRGTFTGGTATAAGTVAITLPASSTLAGSSSIRQPFVAHNGAAVTYSRGLGGGTTITFWADQAGTQFALSAALTNLSFSGVFETT